MQIQPYLFFDGRCEEAIKFYQSAVGAKVNMMMRFKDGPPPQGGKAGDGGCPDVPGDKVMHADVRIGDSNVLMSDGRAEGKLDFRGFALSLTVGDVTEADLVFAALLEGGQVQLPLTQTFFSPRFGMVADRFGVSWMIYVTPAR
jgi:PhnB protein